MESKRAYRSLAFITLAILAVCLFWYVIYPAATARGEDALPPRILIGSIQVLHAGSVDFIKDTIDDYLYQCRVQGGEPETEQHKSHWNGVWYNVTGIDCWQENTQPKVGA